MNHLRSGIPTQHYEFSSIAGRPLDAPSAGPHSPDSLLFAQPTPTALQALPPREHPAESERQMRAQHVKQGDLFSTSGPTEKDAAATQREKANARLRLNTSFVQLKSKVLAERAVQKQRTRIQRVLTQAPKTLFIDGKNYRIHYVQRSGEAGKNLQLKATLTYHGERIPVRIKVLDRNNEALAYQRMISQGDPMASFMPKMYGVVDSAGHTLAFSQPSKIDRPAFLVLRDEVAFLESQSRRVINEKNVHVRDFKLADKPLRSDAIERQINGFPDKSKAYYEIKNQFMNLSRGPFATHTGGFINKAWQMSRTHSYFEKALRGITNKGQLLSDLNALREAMHHSDFAFIDSSLLFIPTADATNNTSLSIKFLDPAHSFSRSAGHPDFDQKKETAVASIDWLIRLVHTSVLENLNTSHLNLPLTDG
jgi:hypothetical protein